MRVGDGFQTLTQVQLSFLCVLSLCLPLWGRSRKKETFGPQVEHICSEDLIIIIIIIPSIQWLLSAG